MENLINCSYSKHSYSATGEEVLQAATMLHALQNSLSTYRSGNIHIHTSRQAGPHCVNVSIHTGLPEVQALETGDWNVIPDIIINNKNSPLQTTGHNP